MKNEYEIRESDNKKFFYLVHYDKDSNQEILIQSEDLKEVQAHPALKGKKLKPVPEADTRGRITPDESEADEKE